MGEIESVILAGVGCLAVYILIVFVMFVVWAKLAVEER